MDFSLNEEQRGWQLKAREFAREELRPASLAHDQIEGGFGPWDWEIMRKGSRLGFRTLAVPEEWGGPGADFVTQGLVMAELASGDSAMSKAFSQNWKWSHQIAEFCTRDQKERFLKPFLADDTFVMGSGSTEPNAVYDNATRRDDPRPATGCGGARGRRWILHGEKASSPTSASASVLREQRTNPTRLFTTAPRFPGPAARGFSHSNIFNKRAGASTDRARVADARVPHSNVWSSPRRHESARRFRGSRLRTPAKRARVGERGVRIRDAQPGARALRQRLTTTRSCI